MAEGSVRDRHLRMLVDRIDADLYPSNHQLDLIESMLRPEEIAPYVDVLLNKVADERYPSVSMLNRIQRLAMAADAA
jgi:hypothetical protein